MGRQNCMNMLMCRDDGIVLQAQRSLFLLLLLGFITLLLLRLLVFLPRLLFLVLRRRLLLTAQLIIRLRIALIVTVPFLFSLEVLIFALVLICCIDQLGLFGLLHVHFHSSAFEILNQGIQFSPLHSQKLDHFLFLPEGQFDVELLVACVDAVELNGLNVLHPEVKDRFWYENNRIFEHIQPPSLSLHVGLHAWLSSLRFEVISRLNQVQSSSSIQQLNQYLELRS